MESTSKAVTHKSPLQNLVHFLRRAAISGRPSITSPIEREKRRAQSRPAFRERQISETVRAIAGETQVCNVDH
jgi:hypothetical protein